MFPLITAVLLLLLHLSPLSGQEINPAMYSHLYLCLFLCPSIHIEINEFIPMYFIPNNILGFGLVSPHFHIYNSILQQWNVAVSVYSGFYNKNNIIDWVAYKQPKFIPHNVEAVKSMFKVLAHSVSGMSFLPGS